MFYFILFFNRLKLDFARFYPLWWSWWQSVYWWRSL